MTKIATENGLKRGPWSEEEDLKLIQYVQRNGPGQWRTLPKKAGLQRCGKSCRLRWTNYLRPGIKRGQFSFEEEETIIELHSVMGNKWSAIAARLPGRTDNEIKNYWNTRIRKRLLLNGIDPLTHTPRVDFSELPSIMNPARFNLQTLVNTQVLKLVTILASLSRNENRELFFNSPYQNHQNSYSTFAFSNLPITLSNQRQLMHNDIQNIPENLVNMNSDTSEDVFMRTCLRDDCFTIPSFSNHSTAQTSENSNFQPSCTENNVASSQQFNYESVLSSSMSSPTPLMSSTRLINIKDSSVEYETES